MPGFFPSLRPSAVDAAWCTLNYNIYDIDTIEKEENRLAEQMQYFGSTSQANTAQTGDEDEDGDMYDDDDDSGQDDNQMNDDFDSIDEDNEDNFD